MSVEFLYLDLETCTRCQGTDAVVDEALSDVARVLDSAGFDVKLQKVKVETEEQAAALRFSSSPTIRVNDKDIQVEVRESACGPCSDISGEDIDCRVWVHEGVEYTTPPKAMVVEAVLREVFGRAGEQAGQAQGPFEVPDNLKRFFAARQPAGEASHLSGGKTQSGPPGRTRCC
ncbi:MAG: DUF2703 domain-containing protein [Bacillota bacterium]|nr:DUF2703 domain-containing protein [Bacillota bacterium]